MTSSIDKFIELLNHYTQEAFRLETLPVYDVTHEKQDFDAFINANQVHVNQDLEEYIATHSKKIIEGKRHIRSRVIPSPMTEYFRYETNVGYANQLKKGFELCFVEADVYAKEFTSKYGIIKDFWLFDSTHLVEMNYDNAGQFLGVEIIEDNERVNKAITIRNEFIVIAKTYSYLIDQYKLLV